MSEADVAMSQRFAAAYNARDADEMERICSDSFEFRSTFVAIEGRKYQGRDAMRVYFADLDESWEVFQLERVEYVQVEEGVLMVFHARAQGRLSGADMSRDFATLLRFSADGSIAGLRTFEDREEAYAVVGLTDPS
jgi:ketosteroid isomerase-like protein